MALDQTLIDAAIPLAHKALYTTDCIGHMPYGFTQYPASNITTRLYASQGPEDIFAVENFISFLKECSIKNIVAIGLDGDFNNYGYCKSESGYTSLTAGETYALHSKKFPAEVQGTLFGVRDGAFLDGTNKGFIHELLNSYVRSLASPTVIHCKAGIGRTGHVIMTFLLFELFFYGEKQKFFDTITEPQDLANHFINILEKLRIVRPDFVLTKGQFEHAIKNAFKLYQFAKDLNISPNLKDLLIKGIPHLGEFTGYEFLLPSAAEEKAPTLVKKGTECSDEKPTFALKIDKMLLQKCARLAARYFEEPSKQSRHLIFNGQANYRATKITSKLYAAEGPNYSKVNNFKLFIEENQIKNILALGLSMDFYNYGFFDQQGNSYIPEGEIRNLVSGQLASDVKGTLFAVLDQKFLMANKDAVIIPLLDSYCSSLTLPTVVHCMQGTGRTGHAIMTFLFFEFLYYGEKVHFINKPHNAEELMQHFQKILETVRKSIPKFVHTANQFKASIENAFYLYLKVKELLHADALQQLLSTSSPHLGEIAGYEFLSLNLPSKEKEKQEQETQGTKENRPDSSPASIKPPTEQPISSSRTQGELKFFKPLQASESSGVNVGKADKEPSTSSALTS